MKRQFLLFENTRAVIQAEAQLKAAAVACRVMPVPRAISSECGMCLELTNYANDAIPDNLTIPARLVNISA
ncbi:DUF3343 domain-containing protein [Kistimonas asteriae]|uniref:DUF3343 domain-containing protein n=1 Tax=Kistimonas asteriae TaxID=517724 RepID=UPI001BA9CA16|nr:DUF3343 domain-containing protein [Kistimonas asteriae]